MNILPANPSRTWTCSSIKVLIYIVYSSSSCALQSQSSRLCALHLCPFNCLLAVSINHVHTCLNPPGSPSAITATPGIIVYTPDVANMELRGAFPFKNSFIFHLNRRSLLWETTSAAAHATAGWQVPAFVVFIFIVKALLRVNLLSQ